MTRDEFIKQLEDLGAIQDEKVPRFWDFVEWTIIVFESNALVMIDSPHKDYNTSYDGALKILREYAASLQDQLQSSVKECEGIMQI